MALKGKAKTDYQREYMRKRRLLDLSVRPPELDPPPRYDDVYIEGANRMDGIDADGNPIPEV